MAAGLLGILVILVPVLLGSLVVLLPTMLWAGRDRRTPTVPAVWERYPRRHRSPGGGSGGDPRWESGPSPFSEG